MEQQLRRLTVKLETSGTATLIENTKLYQDSYAFVGLRVLVPITQNRAVGLNPSCTVHGLITDSYGNRVQVKDDGVKRYWNIRYIENATIGKFDYMVFERLMPKPLMDNVGELDLVFNYSEITTEGKLAARLPTNTLRVYVEEGGEASGEIDIDLKNQEAAQINQNTIAIELMSDTLDDLLQPPEYLGDDGGLPSVEIAADGRLAFANLKGDKGADGKDGKDGKDGINAVIAWGENEPSPVSTLAWEEKK